MTASSAATALGRRLRFALKALSRHLKTPVGLLLAAAFAILALSALIFASVQPPQTITVVDARADKVSFQVRNAAMAAMRLTCMDLKAVGSGEAPEPVDGLFTPADGFDVTYNVVEAGGRGVRAVSVAVEPSERAGDGAGRSNTLRMTASGAARRLDDRLIFAPRPECATERPRRFPIWGAIDIGDELGAASDEGEPPAHLRGGTVNVYARARTLSPGFDWLFDFKPTLYRVADDFPLPFGARVSGGRGRTFAPWQGAAVLDAEGALEVKVTGRGEHVELFLPGAKVPEKIVPSGLAQILADPNVLALQIYVAATTFMMAVIALVVQIAARPPPPAAVRLGQEDKSPPSTTTSGPTVAGGSHQALQRGLEQPEPPRPP